MSKRRSANGGGYDRLNMDEPSTRPNQQSSVDGAPTGLRRLWPWFLAGFAAVFLGISLTVTAYVMLPSGRGLVATPLWRYYIIKLKDATSSSLLGPASGDFFAVTVIASEHALCSLAGGTVVAATVWGARRFGARRRA